MFFITIATIVYLTYFTVTAFITAQRTDSTRGLSKMGTTMDEVGHAPLVFASIALSVGITWLVIGILLERKGNPSSK
jgi:hypothetical protein